MTGNETALLKKAPTAANAINDYAIGDDWAAGVGVP